MAPGAVRLERLDREAWEAATAGFRDFNYRQLWSYGEASAARYGAQVERVAVQDGTHLLGLAGVRIKRLPLLGAGLAYISGGPLVRRGPATDPAALETVLRTLRHEYVFRRGYSLRIQPPLSPSDPVAATLAAYARAGYGPAAEGRPYRTIVLDLQPSLDELRQALHPKWRGSLNQAERQGLQLVSGTAPELLAAFSDLHDEFVVRKGLAVDLGARFYASLPAAPRAAERFLITLARHQDQWVAGHLATLLGDTCIYLLGATSPQGLATKAAFLLQWRVLQTARERGLRCYDLGGIDPDANPGVYTFKRRLGGQDLTTPGPFEAGPAGLRASLVRHAETFYRSWRKRPAVPVGG